MSITKLTATATGKELTAGAKGAAGNSTGANVKETTNALLADAAKSEIAVNALIDAQSSYLGEKLTEAANGSGFNYIVTGDSTRNNTFNNMITYYTEQLSKIGITVINDAKSGLKTSEWAANTYPATCLQHAIDSTPGTGSKTIMEFSLGVNDDVSGYKAGIKAAIQSYLTAKPDATVFIVGTVTYSNPTAMNTKDTEIRALATELGLKYISGMDATSAVYGDPKYYFDITHPNENGSKRIVNYIMSEVLPVELCIAMSISNSTQGLAPSGNVSTTIESNFWKVADGTPQIDPTWRRLQAITVEPNFSMLITTKGDYIASWQPVLDSSGAFLAKIKPVATGNPDEYTFTIPTGGVTLLLNISNNGAVYDALSDTITLKYVTQTNSYMTQQEINAGLSISLPIISPQQGLVDDNGSTGSSGQVPTAQGGNRWLWSTP